MTLTRRGRAVRFVTVIAAVALVGLLAATLYLRSIGVWGSSDPGHVVEVTIPKGAGTSQIGSLLAANHVIKSSFGFRVSAYLNGGAGGVEAGTYSLHTGLTAADALQAMLDNPPKPPFERVTYPEGSWLTDFASITASKTDISAQDFLAEAKSGQIRSHYQPPSIDSLEGLLFPSTYQVVDTDTATSLITRLVKTFDDQASKIGFSSMAAQGYSPYQQIIVASMIEAEAKESEDRPLIAEVIYNRLEAGIKLGIDATVDYALGEHKTSLTTSDLAIDSPYNTRLNAGLPPTPIGAAGTASLEAAAHPATGSYLYYVLADCSGHHAFSSTYDQFLQDKAHYESLQC
ncbi:MAG: endolytic transglycosylase MltG [Actinomycetota bacterium]